VTAFNDWASGASGCDVNAQLLCSGQFATKGK
jgi:hypothetical protein